MFDRLRTRLDAGRQDGFTLIELLIVIVILGVLAGIVVFAVGGITDRGEDSACESDYKTLQVAQEAFFANSSPGAYAATAGALQSGGFLASESELYEFAAGSGGAAYDIDPTTAGGCTYDPNP